MVYRILRHFTEHLTLIGCTLTSPTDTQVMPRPWSKKRAENQFQLRPRSNHGTYHEPWWGV